MPPMKPSLFTHDKLFRSSGFLDVRDDCRLVSGFVRLLACPLVFLIVAITQISVLAGSFATLADKQAQRLHWSCALLANAQAPED